MNLIFRLMRGTFALVAALMVALSAGDAGASDRLIAACEVGVAVHAEHVELRFPSAQRQGMTVFLGVEFRNGKAVYGGKASCTFRETAADEPPSLQSIVAMGQTDPGMFLISHHAIFSHFTGGRQEASAPDLDWKERRNRPPRIRQVAAR